MEYPEFKTTVSNDSLLGFESTTFQLSHQKLKKCVEGTEKIDVESRRATVDVRCSAVFLNSKWQCGVSMKYLIC